MSGDGSDVPPPRVRVTAPRTGAAGRAPGAGRATARGATSARDDPGDVRAVYVRSLIRSQLRLALICAAGFAIATAVFATAVALVPGLDESFVAGVPVSWLLLGFGVYPLAITIGVLYVRTASRNEARYRSLAEET
ncbi:hypothetical protein [Agromyces arachidis]|uniref:hypothetical protein n=1 Tax=Agromyces arachidis TaxID=766966 RepID=UPI0040571CD9